MVPKENAGQSFDIPEEVLEVLPSDPFEQLDVARKLTSIALSTRVSALESDYSSLTTELSHKDALIDGLQNLIDSLNSSLAHTENKFSQAHLLKERLKKENASLSDAVKKLNRDVGKLENFRKTLMRSLQDDDENIGGAQHMVAADDASLSSQPFSGGEDTASLPSSRAFSIQSQTTDVEHLHAEDHDMDGSWPRISRALLLASQTSTPHLTPGSPPTISSPTSPRRTPTPLSPRQHSISFAATRSMLDDRLSSTPSSHQNLMGYDAGRIRVDGKEFFRQVRNRLSYEQFGAFLANVKELNSHKQTRDETLRKADEIFGADNKDLYALFEGLITRITH